MELLEWLENTPWVTWVRESNSPWGYTLYLAGHTIGMVFLVGPNLLLAARVLGLAPALPLKPMASFKPVMNIGLLITLITGSVLFATAPVGYVRNGVFIVKIAAIALALACLWGALRALFRDGDPDAVPVPARVKQLTAGSVLLWTIAVVAGRLTAYSGLVVLASTAAFLVLVTAIAAAVVIGRSITHRRDRREAFALDMHVSAAKGGK